MFGKKEQKDTEKKAIKLPRCEWCGKEFLPASAWQKFCSDAHRKAAHDEKQRKQARE